jgi:hypothetical protein
MTRDNLQGANLLLAIAAFNAAMLSVFAVSSASDSSAQLRALLAGAVATIPSVAAARYPADIPALIRRRPWLPLAYAAVGALMLALAHDSASTLVAAYMTPVGICSLLARWRTGIAVAALLGCGYAASLLLTPQPPSPEVAVSNVLPGFIVVLGAILPLLLLQQLRTQRPADSAALMASPALRPWEDERSALVEPRRLSYLMPPRRAQRGRRRGERPRHSVVREEELISLLTEPGPIPSAVEIARALKANAGVIRAQLRTMRRRAGYEQHTAYVAHLRADRNPDPERNE